VFEHVLQPGDPHLLELVAACPFSFGTRQLDDAIEVLKRGNDNATLVNVLAAKGYLLGDEDDFSECRRCHEQAIEYANNVGRLHLRTAWAHKLFAHSLSDRADRARNEGQKRLHLRTEFEAVARLLEAAQLGEDAAAQRRDLEAKHVHIAAQLRDTSPNELRKEMYEQYKTQLDILDALVGPDDSRTLRAAKDVVDALRELRRNAEADELKKKYRLRV
jgi:hypothetical protein